MFTSVSNYTLKDFGRNIFIKVDVHVWGFGHMSRREPRPTKTLSSTFGDEERRDRCHGLDPMEHPHG